MAYKSLRDCLADLERHNDLVRVKEEVDANLEMAAIHRRVFRTGGPAVLFERVKGSPFPAVSNLFGTEDRIRFIFRHTLRKVEDLMRAGMNPVETARHFYRSLHLPFSALKALPKRKRLPGGHFVPTSIDQLPQLKSWPKDGGGYITLPQVLTLQPGATGILKSNMGMYRVQLGGNQFQPNQEVGLHYQIHRGIGIHHSHAIERRESLPVNIFVGGPPAHSLAAAMPLPENLSELSFAGALAGRRFRYVRQNDHVVSLDADFCICGYIENDRLLPEGPFGDHLGYYSLAHDFPVMNVSRVWHRPGAIWPFTVVGRPPQEDSIIGKFIHDLTVEVLPMEIPGVKAVHAVDASGVHPLLLAIGSERYAPFREREPMELLTQANAVLGYGQLSLAKYLLIVAQEDDPGLDIGNVSSFLQHLLQRVDWKRDLHFQTETTIDTLDYSGSRLNHGSKLIIAAAGKVKRKLSSKPPDKINLTAGFSNPVMVMDGILAIKGDPFRDYEQTAKQMDELSEALKRIKFDGIPLIIVCDDPSFLKKQFDNFLWVVFTRSNPSHDVYGVNRFVRHKHWGCSGSLIIDARIKPHHAPVLEEDPEIEKRVDHLGAPGNSLHGII